MSVVGKPKEAKLDELKQQLIHALLNREGDDSEAWMKIIDSMSNNQVRILKNEVKAELRKRRKNGGVNAHKNPNLLEPLSSSQNTSNS